MKRWRLRDWLLLMLLLAVPLVVWFAVVYRQALTGSDGVQLWPDHRIAELASGLPFAVWAVVTYVLAMLLVIALGVAADLQAPRRESASRLPSRM